MKKKALKSNLAYLVVCYALIVLLGACIRTNDTVAGCMDSSASNYDSKASINCCCEYKVSFTSDFTPPTGADFTASDSESPAYFRMMKATSTDGLNFTTTGSLVSDQANTPDMVEKDNKLFLYYTGWTLGQQKNAIAVAISEDNGANWIYKNCNFAGFGTAKPVDPDAVVLPNGNVRMFATTQVGTKRGIVCYESTDGINFNYVNIVASSSTEDIFDSNTFQLNGAWHMYAINGIDPTHWRLSSLDGVNFNLVDTKSFVEGTDQYFVGNGFVVGSGYRIFSFFLPNKNIKSFSTNDGISWSVEAGARITFGGSSLEGSYLKDPAVIKLQDGTYLMVYVTRIP